jgi:hypothetical protein
MLVGQIAGSKTWFLRPNDEEPWPMGACPELDADHPLEVTVQQGDVLIVNTRLWYHTTMLPPTTEAPDGLSFSVARGLL